MLYIHIHMYTYWDFWVNIWNDRYHRDDFPQKNRSDSEIWRPSIDNSFRAKTCQDAKDGRNVVSRNFHAWNVSTDPGRGITKGEITRSPLFRQWISISIKYVGRSWIYSSKEKDTWSWCLSCFVTTGEFPHWSNWLIMVFVNFPTYLLYFFTYNEMG